MNRFLAFAIAIFLLTSGALRAETITAIGDPWPPYLGPNLPEQGIALELVRAAFKAQGYDVEMNFVPWNRAINGVKTGKYDILAGSWKTKKRTKFLRYSDPYIKNEVKFIKRVGDDFEYYGIGSLDGKSIGIVRGYGYGDDFMNATNFIRFEASELLRNLKMLDALRIDLSLGDEIVSRKIMKTLAPELSDKLTFTKNVFLTKYLHVSSGIQNPKSEAIISAFNKGLAAIKKDGRYDAILKKHGANLSVSSEGGPW